eukprot:CAMPEP_0202000274 /NCGR_PEP_ID=MMETSP0905-20130828/6659_1 /ASSEMBLY_ACC=CAM_ASM_000554 /TAXON_ID=420261 /ORGANISM="Thalassiosira antarctica, Strain CCMP982" /LENGTH=65 /DNA_ID=CAMNT_0048556699 /DNA_START=167 /DNA_END=364 /DNA_ORIENTATION=-
MASSPNDWATTKASVAEHHHNERFAGTADEGDEAAPEPFHAVQLCYQSIPTSNVRKVIDHVTPPT